MSDKIKSIRKSVPEQLLPSDIGKQFSGILIGYNIVPSNIEDKQDLEFIIKVTKTIETEKDYTGLITKPKIRWAKALTGRGQTDLLLSLMETNLKTDDLSKLINKDILWEQHSITELPLFQSSKDFEEKYPRHYPVRFL